LTNEQKQPSNPMVKGMEGLILIVLGGILLFSEVLRNIPETERTVIGFVSIFDLLQLFLRVGIVYVLIDRYNVFLLMLAQFLRSKYKLYSDIKSSMGIVFNALNLALVYFIYKLIVPGLMTFLMSAGFYQGWYLTLANIVFILAGVIFVKKLWDFTRLSLAEGMGTESLTVKQKMVQADTELAKEKDK